MDYKELVLLCASRTWVSHFITAYVPIRHAAYNTLYYIVCSLFIAPNVSRLTKRSPVDTSKPYIRQLHTGAERSYKVARAQVRATVEELHIIYTPMVYACMYIVFVVGCTSYMSMYMYTCMLC